MLKRMSGAMLAACLLAVFVTDVSAQPGGGGRRGGGFGLRGLISMPEVQKEISLSEADAEKITKALDELRPPRGERNQGNENFRELSEEERQKRMEEFRKQFEETAKKMDDKIKSMVTEEQWKRLGELRLQREGVGSLNRAEVATSLKLTDDQKEKIKKVFADLGPQFGRGPGGGRPRGGDGGAPPNFEEIRKEMQQRQEKLKTDVLAVLTPEQKLSWEGLQGAKFTFPEPPPFGGRGDRGDRGQRPAGDQ